MDYSILIAVLLLFKVCIIILFSSQILCITIENPYSVIDSVEELAAKPELIPMLFSAEADIKSLKVIQCLLIDFIQEL